MSTKEYRLEPGARIFFAALLALFWGFCIWGLTDTNVQNGAVSLLSVVFLFAIPLPLLDCILWRLRVDEHGVTQRVYGWNVLWPWKDFSSGSVQMDGARSFVRTDWPWWRIGRKLQLALDLKEREIVLAMIRRHCQQTTLLKTIEDQLQPRWIRPKDGHVVVRILRLYATVAVALAIQGSLVLALGCAWVLFEVVINVDFIRELDEQEGKLVVATVWGVVCYLSTDAICSMLARVGLLERAKRSKDEPSTS